MQSPVGKRDLEVFHVPLLQFSDHATMRIIIRSQPDAPAEPGKMNRHLKGAFLRPSGEENVTGISAGLHPRVQIQDAAVG
jgi:hypothetical protein